MTAPKNENWQLFTRRNKNANNAPLRPRRRRVASYDQRGGAAVLLAVVVGRRGGSWSARAAASERFSRPRAAVVGLRVHEYVHTSAVLVWRLMASATTAAPDLNTTLARSARTAATAARGAIAHRRRHCRHLTHRAACARIRAEPASNGGCNDGGPGSESADCSIGTDCDCGPRAPPPNRRRRRRRAAPSPQRRPPAAAAVAAAATTTALLA